MAERVTLVHIHAPHGGPHPGPTGTLDRVA